MVDLRRVMHQHAKVPGEALVHLTCQAQARLADIGGVHPHPALVQMFQAVFMQRLGEPYRCRLVRQFPHQTCHFRSTAGQQRFDDVYPDKTVGSRHDHFAAVTGAGLG